MSRPPVLCLPAVVAVVLLGSAGEPWAGPASPSSADSPASPSASTWFILTRDGVLHTLRDGVDQPVARALGASRDLVRLDGRRWAVLGKEAVTLLTVPAVAGPTTAFHALPGRVDDLVQLVGGGTRLFGATRAGDVVELSLTNGARTTMAHFARPPLLGFDGTKLLAAHDGVIEELGVPANKARKWPVVGKPIALAATATRVYCATREGPLWQIEREAGSQRDLGLGGWWGTLALDADQAGVYVATQSGKLWQIDPTTLTKVAAAMDGWAGTVGLSVRH